MDIFDIAYLNPSSFGEERIELTRESPYSLVVPRHLAAVDAVRIAEMNQISVICVIDSPKAPRVEGLVVLDWVSDQIRHNRKTRFSLLSDELARMVRDPLEIAKNYHHEWLNTERPDVDWCYRHNHLCQMPCTRVP